MSNVMQALGIFCVLWGHKSTVRLIVQDLIYTCQHRRLVITFGGRDDGKVEVLDKQYYGQG